MSREELSNENQLEVQEKHRRRIKVSFVVLFVSFVSFIFLWVALIFSGGGGLVLLLPIMISLVIVGIASFYTLIISVNYFLIYGKEGFVVGVIIFSLLPLVIFILFLFFSAFF